MSELRRHGRELLEASRVERTPRADLRERLLSQLLESAAQTSLAGAEPVPLAQRLGSRTKAFLVAGLAVVIFGGMCLLSR